MKKIFTIVIIIATSNVCLSQITIETIVENVSFRSVTEKNETFLISGSGGYVLLKSNNTDNWINISPKEYSALDFRSSDIINDSTFIIASAGDAEKGQAVVLRTRNSGKTWDIVYETKEKGAFLDAMKISKDGWGFILGDPIDDKPFLLYTNDFGMNWKRHISNDLPKIDPGEASFAASNSCLQINENNVWFNTQNRVFKSENKGNTWQVYESPFEKLPSRGIFGLQFLNNKNGIAIGGDYLDKSTEVLQYIKTYDGGKTWDLETAFKDIGLSESAVFISKSIILRASLQGSYISKNKGKTWSIIDKTPFHGVACSNDLCYFVGGKGKIGMYKPN